MRPIVTTTDLGAAVLLDVNTLLALVWDQHVHHQAAWRHFEQLDGGYATTPVTESGLVRLLLTRAVVGREVSAAEALGALRGIRSQPAWVWVDDDASLDTAVIDVRVLVGRREVTDLHLVDLAARHEMRLATFGSSLERCLAPADRRHVTVWTS